MSSVLMVAVLIGLWALVLVPAFKGRQARIDALRSVDRFSATMRVLSRRGAHGTPDRRWVVMPPRPVDPVVAQRAVPTISAAARRRRTVLGLAGIALLSLLFVAMFGRAWLLAQLPADAALGAVLVWCARSTARERDRRVRAARRERRAAAERAALAAAQAPAWSPAPAIPVMTIALGSPMPAEPVRRPAPVVAPAPRREVVARAAAARVAVASRPVVADVVVRDEPFIKEPSSGVRLLDLTTPGAWTRRRVIDDEPLVDEAASDDSALDALLARRTAASGW